MSFCLGSERSDFEVFESDRYGTCYTYNYNSDPEICTATGQSSGKSVKLLFSHPIHVVAHGQ